MSNKKHITSSRTKRKEKSIPSKKNLGQFQLNRKAITIIMGFALLVSLGVAAGSVVMKLGSAQVEDQAECAIDINLKITQLSGKDQLCLNTATKTIDFTLENGKNIKVEGLLVNTLGAKKAQTSELNDAIIPKAGMYVGNVPYNPAIAGQIKQVKIIPKVNMYDEEQICTEKAIIIEKIPPC